MRRRNAALGAMVGLAQAWAGGAALAQTPSAPPAAARPPQAECAAVADVDLRRLAREADEARAEQDALIAAGERAPRQDFLQDVQVPEWAERRPPEDAPLIVRARMGPGGGYSTDHKVVVWREADGGWWYWKHVTGGPPAPPPPPPPPGAEPGSPAYEAWLETQPPADLPLEFRLHPPEEGALNPRRAAIMEAAWADPCRGWDPESWPHDLPLNRRIDGSRRRLCPQDSSGQAAEIIEYGVARRFSAACINETPTYQLMSTAVYADGAD